MANSLRTLSELDIGRKAGMRYAGAGIEVAPPTPAPKVGPPEEGPDVGEFPKAAPLPVPVRRTAKQIAELVHDTGQVSQGSRKG